MKTKLKVKAHIRMINNKYYNVVESVNEIMEALNKGMNFICVHIVISPGDEDDIKHPYFLNVKNIESITEF